MLVGNYVHTQTVPSIYCRFLLACCGDGIVRVLNPHTGFVISVLVSKRERDRKTYAKVEAGSGGGGGSGGKSSTKKKRASSILDSVELPCTCAAFRPYNKVSSLRLESPPTNMSWAFLYIGST